MGYVGIIIPLLKWNAELFETPIAETISNCMYRYSFVRIYIAVDMRSLGRP